MDGVCDGGGDYIISGGKLWATSNYTTKAVDRGGEKIYAAGDHTDVILHSTSVRVLRPSQFVRCGRKSSLSFQTKFLLENRAGKADNGATRRGTATDSSNPPFRIKGPYTGYLSRLILRTVLLIISLTDFNAARSRAYLNGGGFSLFIETYIYSKYR